MPRKLRVAPMVDPFHVVLVEPEIPQNTGNIARLCAATQTHLHLCGRLGFRIDEKSVRRAGVDYWHLVPLHVHPNFDTFAKTQPPSQIRLFSANGSKSFVAAEYRPGDVFVFGKESAGLPQEIIERYPDNVYGIPTCGGVRSLNLANAVSIVVYEAMRQVGALDKTYLEGDEGTDFVR